MSPNVRAVAKDGEGQGRGQWIWAQRRARPEGMWTAGAFGAAQLDLGAQRRLPNIASRTNSTPLPSRRQDRPSPWLPSAFSSAPQQNSGHPVYPRRFPQAGPAAPQRARATATPAAPRPDPCQGAPGPCQGAPGSCRAAPAAAAPRRQNPENPACPAAHTPAAAAPPAVRVPRAAPAAPTAPPRGLRPEILQPGASCVPQVPLLPGAPRQAQRAAPARGSATPAEEAPRPRPR